MTMACNGLAKLNEECGELIAIIGKRLAYYHTDVHPDGGRPLSERLEDELADVMASILMVIHLHGLDLERIERRCGVKSGTFAGWHADPDNNPHAIDCTPPEDT